MDEWEKYIFRVCHLALIKYSECKVDNLSRVSILQFAFERKFRAISRRASLRRGTAKFTPRGNKRDTTFIISRGATLNHGGGKKTVTPVFSRSLRHMCTYTSCFHHFAARSRVAANEIFSANRH